MIELLTDIVFVVPAAGVAGLVAGMYFATPIKDFFKGIPADLRTALNNVEADAIAHVTAAKATLVSTAVATALTGVKTAAPAATVIVAAEPVAKPAPAPLAPAPAAAPVAAAAPPISG